MPKSLDLDTILANWQIKNDEKRYKLAVDLAVEVVRRVDAGETAGTLTSETLDNDGICWELQELIQPMLDGATKGEAHWIHVSVTGAQSNWLGLEFEVLPERQRRGHHRRKLLQALTRFFS